jgi:hypothetical protein
MPQKLSESQKIKKYEYTKKWKKENNEKMNATRREYYRKNSKKIIQQQIDGINANPVRRKNINNYWREYTKTNYENRLLTSIKARAKKKGIDFNLDLSDLVIPEFCPKTGIKLDKHLENIGSKSYNKYYDTPSVDRIDNTKGYTKGNIQIVCYWYNVAKLTFTEDEMMLMCKKVVEKCQNI